MKKFLLSDDGRVFPFVDGQLFIEYKGKPPKNGICLVEEKDLQILTDVLCKIIELKNTNVALLLDYIHELEDELNQ